MIYSLPFTADPAGCSRAGAEKALPKAGTQRALVYAAIQEHGPVSDQQLVTWTGLPLATVIPRRWALVQDGLVESVGVQMGPCGVKVNVYAAAT